MDNSNTTPSHVDLDTMDDNDTTVNEDAMDDTTPSPVNQDAADATAPSAADRVATDGTTLHSVDRDTMNDTAVASRTCQKCKKIKVPAEFISEKTGCPTVKCRTCLAPSQKTARNSPDKRKVSPSRKKAENTKIDKEIRERCVSMRVKMGKEKAVRESSAAARENIRKSFLSPWK
jgi:hypothetical protein